MQQLSTHLTKIFAEAYSLIREGKLKTLIPFLPLLKVNGKPMTLERHFQFAPMFNTVQAPNTVWMFGRQLGKSYSLCASSIIRSMLIPNYHQLIIQPQADQIQRLNASVYQPLLRSCDIMNVFMSSVEANKLALKTYSNGSLAYLDFCGSGGAGDPRRLRGLSGLSAVDVDETQDVPYEYLPIIVEVMSASIFWGFATYTGTPKTTDTTLALLWAKSSQAEWIIKCDSCNYYNVPNPEHDLLKMIGKHGPVCAKCGKQLDIRHGGYVHSYPDRMETFPGYHVSQVTHPLHSINDAKWSRILDKIDSYQEVALYNEVLGWPYDAATSPLTLADLINAEYDPLNSNGEVFDIISPQDVWEIHNKYSYITVAVDWSGGGAISDSYTSMAVLGLHPDGQTIDILYGTRFKKGMSPSNEAEEVMRWIRGTGANAFAYDNGGAGFVRLETMKHAGLNSIDNLVIVPINYVGPRSGDVMRPATNQREPDMYYYTLDKSRSLAMCITALKLKRIRVRRFNHEDDSAYIRDFLALREDPRETRGLETVMLIIKKPGVPDDFAHAVNFGCSQIWDHFGAYPRLGSKYDTTAIDFDEHGNHIMDETDFGPRSDFERFQYAVQNSQNTDYSNGVVFPDENPFGDY